MASRGVRGQEMSHEREKSGAHVFYCDSCRGDAEYWQGDVDQDFRTTLAEARADGWITRPANGDWTHVCPECVTKAERPPAGVTADGSVQSSRSSKFARPYRGFGQFGTRRKD